MQGAMTADRRGNLVLALAIVSGAMDATGFLHLGGAFSSVMTGNMVLLGLAAGTANGALAVHAGAAIVAFVLGCIIGTQIAGHADDGDEIWPPSITRALTAELLIFTAYAVVLEVSGGDPRADALRTVLLATNAVALGVQSSAIQRFGVSGLSTTYLTGTLTTTIVHLASRRPIDRVALNLKLLACLIIGAAAGGAIALHAMRLSPVIPLLGVGFVIVMAQAASRTPG
jgi:uncharacterized membrane protein YoaK (UPF0700 family)